MSDSESRGAIRGPRRHKKAVEGRRCNRNVDHGGGLVLADLDSLLTALYVLVDDLLPKRAGAGRRPKIEDAELITLAVAQIFLGCHSERRFLRLARGRLAHLFPYVPKQPGYNKRLRRLARRDLPGHQPPGQDLAIVLRPAQTVGLHTGAVRPVARDGQAVRAGRLGCLRLLRQPLALLLGAAPVFAVRGGRDAGQLLPRSGQRARTGRRRGAARAGPPRRAACRRRGHRRRQRLRRTRVRGDRHIARRDLRTPRPQRRAAALRQRSARSASGSNRSTRPPRASSRSKTTAATSPKASGPASASASSPSPPASGTTGSAGKPANSTRPDATSPTTTTDPVQTESVI